MLDPTGLFRTFAAWRRRWVKPGAAITLQRRLLLSIVRRAAYTRFGVDHGFAEIADVSEFQRRTPLRSFAAHWAEYWEPEFPVLRDCTWPGLIPFFAKSSGTTTGASKHIPYTRDMRRGAARGMFELICHHLLARPESRLLGGSALILSGAEYLEQLAPGVQAGAVSAITNRFSRRWLRGRLLPPPEIANLDDWQQKITKLAPLSQSRHVRGLGGSPNWLLIFLEEVARCLPDERRALASWLPELELIMHGGVNFAPYRSRFRDLLEGSHAETREVYSASEGLFAIADRGDGEGLRLIPNAGVFFEFVPVAELDATAPPRHWIADIETGVEYAVVISTAAGLWGYTLNDTVRFISRNPPRLLVTGRTNYLLSAFGEHLIEEEIADAVSAAAEAISTDILDYTVGARMTRDDRAGGRHVYLVECAPEPLDAEAIRIFEAVLDARLKALNDDYRELREGDFSLAPPEVRFVPKEGFLHWMKRHRGLGGQNKVPRVFHDPALFAEISAFMDTLEEGPAV
jgi:hypothetical protein